MLEKNLNSIIKSSINLYGRATKIPDGQKGLSQQNPFDIFGAIHGYPLYIESKLIKKNLNSFSFNIVEDHQYENLSWYYNNLKCKKYCLIAVGYYVPRVIKGVFFFDIKFITDEKEKGVKSFKKNIITNWYDKKLCIPISSTIIDNKRKEIMDLSNLEEKIIYGYSS